MSSSAEQASLLKDQLALHLPRKALSSTDMAPPTGPVKAAYDKKKLGAVGLRKWVKFDRSGETSIIQADKHAITHQLGVQVGSSISGLGHAVVKVLVLVLLVGCYRPLTDHLASVCKLCCTGKYAHT